MDNSSFNDAIENSESEITEKIEKINPDELQSENSESGSGIHSDSTWKDPVYTKVESNNGKIFSPNHYGEQSGYGSCRKSVPPVSEKKEPPKKDSLPFASIVIVCALVCSLCSAAATWMVIDYKLGTSNNNVVLGATAQSSNYESDGYLSDDIQYTGNKMTASEIYSLSLSQVVGICSEASTNFFGQPTSSAVSGSGFIISEDGYILTNYHVIEYAALYDYDLKVLFCSGAELEASIVGYDESNDIAVIKVDEAGLNPVTFGDSDSISVGETIYTVGNPLGELSYSMTSGIISAKDRVISIDASTSINMFQIDAAVNRGSSGGPIYNEYGSVLGIVTAKYSDASIEGIGFAIPINDVLNIVTQLIETGYIEGRPTLGIIVQTMDSSFASYYNVPQGAYVREVSKGSCADKAGMKIGDIIVGFGDTAITSKEDLLSALKDTKAGDKIKITVHRSGTEETLTIVLDEKIPVIN